MSTLGWIVWSREPNNLPYVELDRGEGRIYRTEDSALSRADDLSVTAMQDRYNCEYGVAQVVA
jgi:hypothetical protein